MPKAQVGTVVSNHFQRLWITLGFQPVFLWSDTLIYILLLCGGVWLGFALRREYWRVALRQVAADRMAMISFAILCLYGAVGFLDTLHFRVISPSNHVGGGNIQSVMDLLCAPLIERTEKTYSTPFATHLFTKETVLTPDGRQVREYPPLQYPGSHILGTDKTGQDVLYISLKSIRTGLIIGTLTTLIVTPFAILCGVLAGYFGGWVDDIIQYVYSTLESIPDILLIAAAMLIFQVGLTEEETIISADKRLVYLCVIMGITSWTGLCRLIRAEVLKLREIEYVQAADAFGVGRARIMLRHLVPNVMHIVLISIVLRFSGLVLAEAVLAYVGIGVDPSMQSWGNMINQARLELARDPVVWWNLFAAFAFMLGLVLPANLFGDAVRDALDPRLRTQ
ncbi:MAG: ABC transporter permease [Deltaproteobacteria bacterium]|nr:ABC transporter permease [Deltaproteobacteria bacterium]